MVIKNLDYYYYKISQIGQICKMKYKIHYKALDEVHNLEPIVEFMKSINYVYSSYNGYLLHFKKEEEGKNVTFTVNYKKKTILKYFFTDNKDKTTLAGDTDFTKEELRFFDALDYEVDSIIYGNEELHLLQDITDWMDM